MAHGAAPVAESLSASSKLSQTAPSEIKVASVDAAAEIIDRGTFYAMIMSLADEDVTELELKALILNVKGTAASNK